MKKLLTLTLAALLCLSCFGLYGCNTPTETSAEQATADISTESAAAQTAKSTSDTYEALPAWDPDQAISETLEDKDYVYGPITAKYGEDVLMIAPATPRMIELWGETVYIRTDEASEWCVGDEIEINFTKVERLQDSDEPVMIIADEVRALVLCYKPVIYLYPESSTEVSVTLTLNGRLTCTYPDYNAGWKGFTAHPDGTLVFPDGKEYYCLYWEGIQNAEWDFSTGFCVKGKDTAAFLEWALAEQGLTAREANEFIIYWLPRMQDNPYNVISFQTDAYTDTAVLEITPKPDSLLRICMAYYATDKAVELPAQSFERFEREGFVAVEWGGVELKEP